MHDVLAHRLSLLSVHAGALEFRPDAPPEEIAEAAGVIRANAREALQELREVIGVLRSDGRRRRAAAADARRDPVADRRVPRGGDEGHAHVGVEGGDVLLGRTAYRVVQEGLTNARKHAPAAAVEVTVAAADRHRGCRPPLSRRDRQPALGARTRGRAGRERADRARRAGRAGGRRARARPEPARRLRPARDAPVDPVIRVLLVDDDALVRSGLRMMLAGAAGIDVVGEAGDGREVLAAVDRHRPDVVLMDIRMPAVDGIEATRLLRAQPSPPSVIVLTTFDADELVLRALRAGAAGFLLKDTPPPEIVRAIEHVHAGDGMLSPTVTRRLIALVAGDDGGRARGGAGALRHAERA